MIASDPCYKGTIYDRTFANEKISRITFAISPKLRKTRKLNLVKFSCYMVMHFRKRRVKRSEEKFRVNGEIFDIMMEYK